MDSNKNILRVAVQLIFSRKIVSLVAETDMYPFKKGDVVRKVTRTTLEKMERPLSVQINSEGMGTLATDRLAVKRSKLITG